MTIVVFMVAGMSSRFGGNPKQMAIVGPKGETLIEYSVNQALENKFKKLVFITNPKTEYLFKNIFGNKYRDVEVLYVEQKYDTKTRTRPWGTADAISHLLPVINDNFIMVNGDDIYGSDTFKTGFEMMNDTNNNIIGGLKVIDTLPESGYVNRGVIFVKDKQVSGLKEMLNINKKDNKELYNELANMNFIGLQYETLKEISTLVNLFKKEHSNEKKLECILTDILDYLIKEKGMKMDFFEIKNKIIGITNPGHEIKLKKQLQDL